MVSQKGFSLLELLVILAILIILAGFGTGSFSSFYNKYKFKKNAYSLEYFIKEARLYALKTSTNIGICVPDSRTVEIINMGANRTDPCAGSLINSFVLDEGFTVEAISQPAFDPRGIAIFAGNLCIEGAGRYYKIEVAKNSGYITSEEGEGNCP